MPNRAELRCPRHLHGVVVGVVVEVKCARCGHDVFHRWMVSDEGAVLLDGEGVHHEAECQADSDPHPPTSPQH